MLDKEVRPWELRWEADFLGVALACREAAARVIGARTEDISLTLNTSTGLQTVAQGLPWQPGDEVVAPLGEFPSNAWPWKALASRGVAFREVPLWEGHRAGAEAWTTTPPPPDVDAEARLLEALGPRTQVLALSWVRFQDGLKLDLARLGRACRERGVALVVDGIQGCGTEVPDLTGVAALSCGGHKGLLAPQGQGFLWTDPAFRARLQPEGTWLGVEGGTDFTRPSTDFNRGWLADGRGLEPGSPSLLGCAALAASLGLLGEVGVPVLTAHVRRLQAALLDQLAAMPAWRAETARLRALWAEGKLGPFLALHHGGRGAEGLQALVHAGLRQGIYTTVREGYLRLALHGFHGEADVARLAGWLA
jgi:selenocysteine lyase/cysteine desulfurase